MPNPPRAKGLKVISGTTRPSREMPNDIDYGLVEQFPEPPQHLDADGAQMWSHMGPILVGARVLQVTDLYTLEQMCVLWQSFRKNAKAGFPQTASESNALRAMFSEFGMTPAARAKIRLGEKEKEGNKFARNRNGKPQAKTA